MKKNIFFLLSSIIALSACSRQIERLDSSSISPAKLTGEIDRLTNAAHVTGMVVVVFNDDKPVYEKAFGYKNADTKEPLQINTEFYGASLSKSIFSVLIMKLVERGVLDLDKPLQEYLPNPVYDYPQVTPRAWHEDLLQTAIADVYVPWKWENYIPYNMKPDR
jgi:CubicO group peptidase (beta-lactamase class C family)